jgi:hypothetical protein
MAVNPEANAIKTSPAKTIAPATPMPPNANAGGNEPATTVSGAAAEMTMKKIPHVPICPDLSARCSVELRDIVGSFRDIDLR